MLFEKLFNFRPDDLKGAERRLLSRYNIAPTFPLSAWLATAHGEIPARVVDMSAGGIGVVLAEAPPVAAGAEVRVNFDLAGEKFSSTANLRHMRPGAGGVQCGLEVGLDDLQGRKAFTQLLIPVSIGASLAKTVGSRPPIPEPNLERIIFGGDSGSWLTVWCRIDADRTPESFEFQVDDYFVRGHGADPVIHAFSLVDDDRPHRAKDTAPLFKTNSRLESEICQLYRWSMLNLNDRIPERIRVFLAGFN